MTQVNIRAARPEDVPALVRIRAAVRENVLSDPSKVPAEAYHGFIDHSTVWIWEEGGRIVGFSAADPGDGTIWALFVAPGAEGRGIGRALLHQAVEDIRRAGWTRARLTTEPQSRAERFYRQAGWVQTGVSTDGDLILERPL